MTYNASEASVSGSKPVELYRFVRGTRRWYYTTADVIVTYNGETYSPQVLRRGELPQNEERDNATLDLFMDLSLDMVQEFISGSSPVPTDVTVIRHHRDETVAGEYAVIFLGSIAVIVFAEGEVHLTCVPIQKSIQRKVPRWLYQPQCNHMLYDQYCTVNPAGYTFSGTITAIVARTLTVPTASAKPDGYYNGGYITDGETFAFIQQHTGTSLLLLATTVNIKVGDAITMTAGCDRDAATCQLKFANLPNFMGFPYIPGTNPYHGLM